jgi:hypothetical protein
MTWITEQVKLFRKFSENVLFNLLSVLAPLASIVGNVLLYECSKFCRANTCDEQMEALVAVPTVDYDTNIIAPSCGHDSPGVKLVLGDRALWKSARLSYHQLLMATVLMHLEQKRNFGRLLIEVCLEFLFVN